MRCTLLVPDLFWTGENAAEVCGGLALRALQKLLARAHVERDDPVAPEGWLCRAFEVERQQDWPVAPLTLALHGRDAGDAYWLRADPVHLQLQRDRVALMADIDISREDADVMVAALNAHFAPDGLDFIAPTPNRWYLRLATPPALVTQTLGMSAGRDAKDVLPAGADAQRWRQVVNEIQMVLHALPANDARSDRGAPPINSVWLWGGGRKTAVRGNTFDAVWSNDTLAQALGALADVHSAALPAGGVAWLAAAQAMPRDAHHLLTLDTCAPGATYGDPHGWRAAVSELEIAWMQPLAEALRKGALASLTIAVTTPHACWRFTLGPRNLYRFWIPTRPFMSFCTP